MRPTAEEIKHWHSRCGFASMKNAAAALDVRLSLYQKWFYGDQRAPAVTRRLMQYIERFGKWEQILRLPKEEILAWQEKLPASADTESARQRSEWGRAMQKRMIAKRNAKST